MVRAFIQNVVKRFGRNRGILRELTNGHHIDHGRGLIGFSRINHVEVGGAVALDVVSEEVVDGFWYANPAPSSPKG